MAAEIRKQLDVDAQLIESGGGIFDVKVNGQLIYSKFQTGRFPEHWEIIEALRRRPD